MPVSNSLSPKFPWLKCLMSFLKTDHFLWYQILAIYIHGNWDLKNFNNICKIYAKLKLKVITYETEFKLVTAIQIEF